MPAPTPPARPRLAGLITGIAAMTLVGGSVGVSRTLTGAPLFTAQAIRYAAAVAVLLVAARSARVPILRPRGREWLWLAGIAAAGLVLFNVAIVRGVAHAEPAVIAVAVACVPVLLGLIGPLAEHQAAAGSCWPPWWSPAAASWWRARAGPTRSAWPGPR
jgi:drug/metabolite transporter (DMT)-like permease